MHTVMRHFNTPKMRKASFLPVLAVMMAIYMFISCTKEDIRPAELSKISIQTPPTKAEYYIGEDLDLSGLIIELSWDNGVTEDLALADFASKEITCLPENGSTITDPLTLVTIIHTSTYKSINQVISIIQLADIDGNGYPHVKIGNQLWMAENLRTTKYNDGTSIPLVTENSEWDNLITPAYCWYDNDEARYSQTYGALYNWYTVETGKLCPTGWHVPTDAEWTELTDYLTDNGHSGTEGTAITAKSGWYDGSNGTDDYGFAALPGGYRGYGTSDLVEKYAYWWSSTEYSSWQGRLRIVMYFNSLVLRDYNNKKLGFSVRCMRDRMEYKALLTS